MQPLPLPNAALSLSAHPIQPLLAIGTTTHLLLAQTPQDAPPKTAHTHALSAIHATAFLGETALAATANKVHTFHTDTAGTTHTLPTTPESCTVTALTPFTDATFLAGDDVGGIHLVDTRAPAVASSLDQGDYISALTAVSHLGTDAILSASGDGTLCAYDVRLLPNPRVKLMYATDTFQDDLLSLALLDGRAVAGTLSGALNVYDLRFMDAARGDDVRVDRFFGHPECVNAVLPWEDVVVTASSDGYVRIVDVAGRRLLGLLEYDMEKHVGEGKRKEEAWPVEGMVRVAAWDRPVFALQGHDQVVRFCDGRALVEEEEDGEVEGKGNMLEGEVDEEMGKKKKKRRKAKENDSAFFDDL